ncbi:MAG: sulfite exporter TauE/SafE family protein [Sphingomonadaceae bacterium]
MAWLALAFLLTAGLYASVGFGGGSTYTALLALAGVDPKILPTISLLCNIIVVTGGSLRYAVAGEVAWKRVLPLVAVSAPLALLGGLTPIKQQSFMLILALSLVLAGLLLLVQGNRHVQRAPVRTRGNSFDLLAGAATGYLAGLVGIGGGIFLAPLLHLTRWGSPRAIAATSSVFILINSLFGLAGQIAKNGTSVMATALAPYWPLAFAVLIGGLIGNYASLRLLSQALVRRATAVLILYVGGQLLWKQLG